MWCVKCVSVIIFYRDMFTCMFICVYMCMYVHIHSFKIGKEILIDTKGRKIGELASADHKGKWMCRDGEPLIIEPGERDTLPHAHRP